MKWLRTLMVSAALCMSAAAAFAADGQAASVQVSPDAYSYCHDGYGRGHHHGCGW